ncbi:hypothetical protein KIPB_017135, partial [Kipferlia bialata]
SAGQYLLAIGGLDHESTIHAYDTTTDTWACWGDAPLSLDAAIGMNIDAETALL